MAYIFGSIWDRLNRNALNALSKSVEYQGKSIQDLVAEGQLTPAEYAQLISIVNGNIARGDVVLDDINFNQQKITEGMIADSLLQIMAGNAPVNAVPPENSITKKHLMTGSVTADKIPHTKNLSIYDDTNWTIGGLSIKNIETDSKNRIRSGFISAKKGSVIRTLNNDVDFVVLTYNKSREVLADGGGWTSGFEVTQENTNYIRITVRYKDDRIVQSTSNLSNHLIVHTFEGEKESLEFMSPAKWLLGSLSIMGIESDNLVSAKTDYIKSEENQYVSILDNDISYFVVFYDEDMEYVTFSSGWTKNTTIITHPYFRIAVKYDDGRVITDNFMKDIYNNVEIKNTKVTSGNIALNSIEREHLNFNPESSQLEGKKMLNFGDSIASAATANVTGYHREIAQKNDMMMNSYASGGATFVIRVPENDNHIIKQVENAINNNVEADYILLNGGTNDANVVTPERVGEISVGYDTALDTSTFCGAFEYVLKNLRLNWLSAKIIYIRAHNMSSRDHRQVTLGNLAIEMCEKWSIPYVDLYKEGGLNTQIPEMIGTYTIADADKTHPNTLGYKLFYTPIIESKMKSI